MLETNKHSGSVLQHCFFLGGRGVTTGEKGVFIQIQNTIVSSKALVLVVEKRTYRNAWAMVEIMPVVAPWPAAR